ncbi:hypothetical protein BST45_10610 [Mycobacterium shinjukuense]|nr:hypothetical protein BST45_10610 [Mycobacterium shinjukuense]
MGPANGQTGYGQHIPATRDEPGWHPGTENLSTPTKGRPPPGGEEARVVVHQPRGVGLIHPRLRPSNAYYTHARRDSRKYRFCRKAQLEPCKCGQQVGGGGVLAPGLKTRWRPPQTAHLCWIGEHVRLGSAAANLATITGTTRSTHPHRRLLRPR